MLSRNKAAYDKVIAARKQAKERIKVYDAKRRKLKEDLEAREEAYKRTLDPTYNTKSDEERLKVYNFFFIFYIYIFLYIYIFFIFFILLLT